MASRLRLTEFSLLILPACFLALGFVLLEMVRPGIVGDSNLGAVMAVVALVLAAHLVLVWKEPGADQMLLPIVVMLASVGLVVVMRLDPLLPGLALRQTVWVALGAVLLVATVLLLPDIRVLQRYKYTSGILAILMAAIALLFGQDLNGSGMRAWIGLLGLYFQPTEAMKLLLVIFLAGYLEDKRELLTWSSSRLGWLRLPPLPYLAPLLVMWSLSMVLIVGQRDLGAALLLFSIFLAMLYMTSGRLAYLWGGLAGFAAGSYICFLAFAHVRLRVEVWLDPWSRAQDQGYQVVQALVGLASGGILGSGLGYGYPGYVPAVYTDFVISAIGEEMGLAGALAVVGLFAALVYRGFRIALDARDPFSSLLAAGLTSVLGLQSVVILAGTVKLIPLTGVTLPFISYGGSSIVTNFIIIGLLLRISSNRDSANGA